DLLARVPGFTIDRGASLRGFGGGAGNVLIDGERPAVKSGGLEEFLSRIPADAVERVDVIRGAQRAGETAGQSLIANIIRKDVALSGAWSAELERSADGRVYPRAEVSVVTDIAGWTTTNKLNAFWERFPFQDATRIRRDEEGALIQFQEEQRPTILTEAFLASEAKRVVGGGTLTLNGRFGWSGFYLDNGRLGFDGRFPDGGPPDDSLFIDFDSEFFEGEVSADWTRTVADDWSLKLIGLASARDIEQQTVTTTEAPVGNLQSTSLFTAEQKPFEALARATISDVGGAFRPEFGVELAYNRRDSALTLTSDDGSGPQTITLPSSDVLVEELRGEAFANMVWVASPKWTIEAGLAAEVSEISVSGDADNTQSFAFAKPSAAVNYTPTEGVQFRLGARRTVGQLSFSDFAASAEAEDDRFLGGNPDLGPDQTTRVGLTTDLRAKSGAALNVEVFHEWRDDVLEQIVLPSGVFGVANAGRAEVWGFDADASLPLSFLIPGGLLEADIAVRDSNFDDPLTGQTRRITRQDDVNIDIDFRQDLPEKRIAWGFRYEPPTDTEVFFADEESFESRETRWTVFAETTRYFGGKTQLEFRNIGAQDFPRERLFFDPDRSGTFAGSEVLERDRGMFITLNFTSQF
ncbi:MAG: TonB-dependent receptor, partial [Pseudomonadota bacterium]